MKNRRDFLKNAGALTLGGIILPRLTQAEYLFSPAALRPVGIQLYTLFRSMNEDPQGTLKQIAAAGYKEVESAFNTRGGYYGYSAKEFKKVVEDLGMKWRAHHAGGAPRRPRPAPAASTAATQPANPMPANMPPMLNLRDNYQQLVDEATEGGLSYLVCSSTPVSTVDEINKSIEVFQKTGEAAKKAGIGFAYHNHATEFDPVEGGKTPYELILSQTDKDLVKMELDLAWATKAGKDPVELFKGQPGRFPLWHIKDIKSDLKTITEVGNGVVDFKRIFTAAKLAGLKYIFVEQDMAPGVDSIQTSYQNLTKVLA
ncbi:sugar phosphate isomerase/epimerase [Spirosoma taeanense]|uniref:Sugar phosphate isomerase/epimerase n=1 Tax=Spirosoma taeanense TaxID=2735870 RepID=A0A6M5YD61_9BACT|nr:sugar phosphate isomerase/epimerase [Spirosoma taeanense]QJW91524.1 sugar phosphate isomerase/epimerase [Spirosoma taeanense]